MSEDPFRVVFQLLDWAKEELTRISNQSAVGPAAMPDVEPPRNMVTEIKFAPREAIEATFTEVAAKDITADIIVQQRGKDKKKRAPRAKLEINASVTIAQATESLIANMSVGHRYRSYELAKLVQLRSQVRLRYPRRTNKQYGSIASNLLRAQQKRTPTIIDIKYINRHCSIYTRLK